MAFSELKQFLNQTVEVLIEKESKKSTSQWSGRSAQNTVAVFPKEDYKIGDFVKVKIKIAQVQPSLEKPLVYLKIINYGNSSIYKTAV